MNRLASLDDQATFGARGGDVIFDTPNEKNTINYYFIGKQWPMLTGEPTFWFDGAKLGYLDQIRFQNTVDELPWPIKQVRFKNIPGTTVKFKNLTVKGVENFILDGGRDIIYRWPKERVFLTGNFGFHSIQDNPKGLGYDVSVQPEGSINMRGFEAQFGFANLRLQQKNKAANVSLSLSDFYIHDTHTGENAYIGSTQAPPIPTFKHVNIYNGVLARAAAEAFQLQNMAGGFVSNLTIYAADTSWLSGFERWQDKGIQLKANGGFNHIKKCIIDGYADTGLLALAADEYIPGDVNQVLIEDSLFFDGRGTGVYFDSGCNKGMEWRFKNVYFGGFNNTYYEETGNVMQPFIFWSGGKRSDKVVLEKVIHDGSKVDICDDPLKYHIEEVIKQAIPRPRYVNSGFPELASSIMQWKQHYAPYFGAAKNTPVNYKPGQIVIDINGEYTFYKCNLAHTVGTLSPNLNPECWTKLTWDLNGIRSDQQGFFKPYSNIPPDDFRMFGNSWSNMGIEVREEILEEYYINGKRITITNLNRYEQWK